jgi:pimeloyl-ACP methyl ester carboxylesterase
MLNIIRHDGPDDPTPLLIAHKLYGSGRNWGVIAKRLSSDRTVIAVDMRNHAAAAY